MTTRERLFAAGALTLLAGATLKMVWNPGATYLYCAGALLVAIMQFADRYRGNRLTLKRLMRQQLLGAAMLLVAGGAMFWGRHNEWIVFLAVGALFELYTSFRIAHELEREEKEKK